MQEQIRTYQEQAAAIRYLLCDLEDGEASAVEQRYFSDRSYFHHLQSIEAALIRTYLADTLGPREKSLFEQKYLKVLELRAKVMLAKQYQELSPNRSRQPWAWLGYAAWRPTIGYGLAVVLVASTISTVWLFTRNEGLEREIAQLRVAPSRRPGADTSIAQQLPGARVFSLVLLPGSWRGTGRTSNLLPFAATSQEIRLQLDLLGMRGDAVVAAELYRTEAENRRLVWSSAGLHPAPTPQGRTVLISFAAGALGPGDYVVYIKPSPQSPTSSALASFVFSISAE